MTPRTGHILLTGATGYVGGRLLTQLVGRGYGRHVVNRSDAVGRLRCGHRRFVLDITIRSGTGAAVRAARVIETTLMTRARSIALVATLLAAALLVLATRRGPARPAVEVGVVARQARVPSTVSASGEIVPTRYADVGASAMGKIVSLPVAEGDRVEAGQPLARIDPIQAESDERGATAQMRALEAEARAAAEQVRAAGSDLAAAARTPPVRSAATRSSSPGSPRAA